jgi:hypothetical protein
VLIENKGLLVPWQTDGQETPRDGFTKSQLPDDKLMPARQSAA